MVKLEKSSFQCWPDKVLFESFKLFSLDGWMDESIGWMDGWNNRQNDRTIEQNKYIYRAQACLSDGIGLQQTVITKTCSLRPGWRSNESQAAVQPSRLQTSEPHVKAQSTLGGECFPWDLCIWRLREMDSTLLDNTLVIIRVITDPFESPASVITLFPPSLSCLFRFLLFQADPEIGGLEMAFLSAR